MYSVDEIKELLSAFNDSKATKLDIKNSEGEHLVIVQKKEYVSVNAAEPITDVHRKSACRNRNNPVKLTVYSAGTIGTNTRRFFGSYFTYGRSVLFGAFS